MVVYRAKLDGRLSAMYFSSIPKAVAYLEERGKSAHTKSLKRELRAKVRWVHSSDGYIVEKITVDE